jgi:hypothetical protein
MDSGLSDCADRIEREIRKESNMERRNLMELRLKLFKRPSTYPNPPRTFKSLHESPRVSLGNMRDGVLKYI